MALVIDASSDQGSFPQFLSAVANTMEQFLTFSNVAPVAQIAILSYSSTVNVELAFNGSSYDKGMIQNRITNIQQHTNSGHNLAGALDNVRSQLVTDANGRRLNTPNVTIIFTTHTSDNIATTYQAANQLKSTDRGNSLIVTVGVGNSVNQQELQTVATQPAYSNIVSSADNLQSLSTISAIASEACPTQPESKQLVGFTIVPTSCVNF